MNGRSRYLFVAMLLALVLAAGCTEGGSSDADGGFVNPGDYLGGGGEVSELPEESTSQSVQEAEDALGTPSAAVEELPADAQRISEKATIQEAGSYYVTEELQGKITVDCAGVVLYLVDAALSNEKKVIESSADLTITLMGSSSLINTNADGSNAIDCEGVLTLNGSGSLHITATKNAIKAKAISVVGATLDIQAEKDGLHAEIDAYDSAESAPRPSYSDGGFVSLDGAKVDITCTDDGIQADTFVYITGESAVNILAGGGAPETVTQLSSDNASGKGIKAGAIDWGADGTDLEWDGYLVSIDSGSVTIDSNDDALHSNGEMSVSGGVLALRSGDDAMHADELLCISGGEIAISQCYEGIEGAKVEISGGDISVQASEDGINAADGSDTTVGVANSNCHIIISGGRIAVDCVGSEGDGIDSNGSILISGGEIYVAASQNTADASLDADGGIVVNGGYLFAVGALGMVETPASNSAQCCVSYARNAMIAADTTLYLCDADGQTILYFTTPRACQSVIISCPELVTGASFSLYGGDSVLTTFTISSVITLIGSDASIGNPGGMPGGNRPGTGTPGFGGGRW